MILLLCNFMWFCAVYVNSSSIQNIVNKCVVIVNYTNRAIGSKILQLYDFCRCEATGFPFHTTMILVMALAKPVGVHCRMGRGRTGVMAACYLVRFHDLSPERAIMNIRLMRPGSVETYEQEKAVIAYTDYLRSINES